MVLARLEPPPDFRSFSAAEQAAAAALLDQLLGQRDEPRVPVAQLVDDRLASEQADGWRYEDMPEDGLVAAHVWSLWTRYACTAFYAHPHAWAEMGFPGPAYPRGYKNPGLDRPEPFEVRDARPSGDPVREGS